MRIFITLVIALFIINSCFSQSFKAPFTTNLSTDQLNLSPSNIDLQQESTGKIFIGNIEGLIVKSGKNYEPFNINQNSVINGLF